MTEVGHVAADGIGRGRVAWHLALGLLPAGVPASGTTVTITCGRGERQGDQHDQGQEDDNRHDNVDQIRP